MMQEVVAGMAAYADVSVIGPRGCRDHLSKAVQVTEVPHTLFGFVTSSLFKGTALWCRRQRFDIIIGGSGLIAPLLAVLQGLFGARTAIFLHGLDVIVPSRMYQALFIPAIGRADLVIANSRNTARLAHEQGVAKKTITVINPGCHPPDEAAHSRVGEFRRRHGLGEAPLMLFVGRMTRRKGLSRFISECFAEILERVPGACLLVVGSEPVNSLNGQGESKSVMESISLLTNDQKQHLRFLGHLNNDDLNTCYASSNIHVFPLIEVPGDVEGFGLVVVEAASYGTPTVAFNVGGVKDAIDNSYGYLVTSGNYRELSNTIINLLKNSGTQQDSKKQPSQIITWEIFNEALKQSIEKTLFSTNNDRREQ